MRFSADWHDDARNAAAEERATVADLRLWLDGQNVCLHVWDAAAVDHVTLPLYPLAEGLAHQWWTLFGSRDAAQSFIRYRSGYAIPDLRLSFDGEAFTYTVRQRRYRNPPVRFWADTALTTTRAAAEAQLSGFIEAVLDRLRTCGIPGTSAALRWQRVQASRADLAEAAFCEAAGALRLDPYQIDAEAAAAIEAAAALFEGECLAEFLAGTGINDCRRLIAWVGSVESRSDAQSRVADLPDLAAAVSAQAANPGAEPAWARGYRHARLLRQVMGWGGTRRFATWMDVAKAVGAGARFALAPPVNGIRLLRSHKGADVHLHVRTHGRSAEAQASHLFTVARGVGDVVCFPLPQRAPVNELRAAYRQAAGRAFAAEFLAPVREVLAMQADGHDAVAIAEDFAVSTDVIERQIENADRIEAACRPPAEAADPARSAPVISQP